jgi:hypothetical protein
MGRLKAGHIDPYEPGTQRERGYMCGISLVYKDDCMEDTATVTATVVQRVIRSIKVFTQDAMWELDELAA